MDLFTNLSERFKFKDKKVRLFECFSGIGTQAMALKRLGVEVEHIGFSEIDKYAIQSYLAIHGDVKNYGDITEIKGIELPKIDILTWSFPCTDLSKAGKQKGLENTRSGLGYEVIRIIEEMKEKPTVLLMENVPDLIGSKFKKGWGEMYHAIEKIGYKNHVELLNSKNFGVAQNRNRVFMVSILGDYSYTFPKGFKLDKKLKDYLQDEVDEKYYLSDKQLAAIKNPKYESMGIDRIPSIDDDTANAITTSQGGNREPKISYAINSREFKARGWLDQAPTLCARDYKDPKVVMIPEAIIIPKPIQIDIQTKVKVRSNEVNIESLKECLRKHKTISNKEISNKLKLPLTLVEHWFRKDNSFAIPNAEIWYQLKELLNIDTTEFDKSITEFEIKNGEYDMSNRAYHEEGISPTITSTQIPNVAKPSIIIPEATVQGYAVAQDGDGVYIDRPHQKGGVVQKEMIQTIKTRGMDVGAVVKDIPICINSKVNGKQPSLQDRVYSDKGTMPAITTGFYPSVNTNLRIRKLTPLECWRLMGIDDEDFYKAQSVVSNSQLYKQAGNAIVVDVLYYIFKQLF